MGETIFLVGRHLCNSSDATWGFVGIFSKLDLAILQCLDGDYFYAPITLNDVINIDIPNFDGICYPTNMSKTIENRTKGVKNEY